MWRQLHNKNLLFPAVAYLLAGAMSFADRNSPNGTPIHRYGWLLWLFGAAIWLHMAFSPDRKAP